MNDKAREALVQAALNGHKQARGKFHHENGGDCAMGVLHIAQHGSRAAALVCLEKRHGVAPWGEVELWAGMSKDESLEVACHSDDGWDFLTIVRKIGHDKESV